MKIRGPQSYEIGVVRWRKISTSVFNIVMDATLRVSSHLSRLAFVSTIFTHSSLRIEEYQYDVFLEIVITYIETEPKLIDRR